MVDVRSIVLYFSFMVKVVFEVVLILVFRMMGMFVWLIINLILCGLRIFSLVLIGVLVGIIVV